MPAIFQKGFVAGAAHEIDTGKNPARLAAALSRADLDEMGRKGRTLVEDQFSWPSIAARQEAIYRWALGQCTPGQDVSLPHQDNR